MKKIAIMGSTGSIGRRTLDVVRDFPNYSKVVALSTHQRIELLQDQIEEFNPGAVCVTGMDKIEQAKTMAKSKNVKLYYGSEGLSQMIDDIDIDLLVVSTVGATGLIPTLKAIQRKIDIALANKEVLVIAGPIVMEEARNHKVNIIPIDSEHSAIFQCLEGNDRKTVRRIILTASGGPFLNKPPQEFAQVTVEETLSHPTWSMGPKITIDSATLMNKGFEIIEGHYLFEIPVDNIEVIIHPQSIIHSMVEFFDGSVLAQLSVTDMYLPIQNALFYPQRLANTIPSLDFAQLGRLEFQKPSEKHFPCLSYAYEAAKAGGTMPAVLNAANEIAVERFLYQNISFVQIPQTIRLVMDRHKPFPNPSLSEILAADNWARNEARKL